MPTLIKTSETKLLTAIVVGSRITFIGDLPGGDYDNYSGYSNRGAMYGTVVKINKVTCDVETRDGNIYRVKNIELTNIEDLF
jgi:hypothetical protein